MQVSSAPCRPWLCPAGRSSPPVAAASWSGILVSPSWLTWWTSGHRGSCKLMGCFCSLSVFSWLAWFSHRSLSTHILLITSPDALTRQLLDQPSRSSNLQTGSSFRGPSWPPPEHPHPTRPPTAADSHIRWWMAFSQCSWPCWVTDCTLAVLSDSNTSKLNLNSLTWRVHMWILLAADALLHWTSLQTITEGSHHLLNHPCPTFKGDEFTLPEEIHSDTLG